MNKENLTIEQAREILYPLDKRQVEDIDGGQLNDLLGNLYTSDMLSKWRYHTEKDFISGDDAIESVIDSWIQERDKQVELSNAINTYGWRMELHGFRNGVRLACQLLKELGQPVPGR